MIGHEVRETNIRASNIKKQIRTQGEDSKYCSQKCDGFIECEMSETYCFWVCGLFGGEVLNKEDVTGSNFRFARLKQCLHPIRKGTHLNELEAELEKAQYEAKLAKSLLENERGRTLRNVLTVVYKRLFSRDCDKKDRFHYKQIAEAIEDMILAKEGE